MVRESVSGAELPTAMLGLLALAMIGVVLYSLVRRGRRRYPARALGFGPLAGADPVFRDRVAEPYLAAQPRYRLDGIFQRAGTGYRLYSYDVYPPDAGAHCALAIVDDRLELPRFSITGLKGRLLEPGGAAASTGGPAGLPPAEPETVVATAIAVPECPAFDSDYLVVGAGAPDVRRVLARPILDWFAGLRSEPGMGQVAIWGAGPLLVWAWDDATFNSPDLAANLQTSLDRLVELHGFLLV